MLLLADQSPLEFFKVQGLHALLPHLYVTGNQPDPSWGTVVFGLISGTVFLLVALLASLRLTRWESSANRPRALRAHSDDPDHPFQTISITCSKRSRSPVPDDADQSGGGRWRPEGASFLGG